MSILNRCFTFIFLLINLTTIWLISDLKRKNNFHLTFFDVGQGDSALIEYKGINILIDGGDKSHPLSDQSFLIDKLNKKHISALDIVILSHPHMDHLYGILDIINRNIKVELIIKSDNQHNTILYKKFISKVQDKGIKLLEVSQGFKISVGELVIDVLSPSNSCRKEGLDNNSLVTKIGFKDKSILFTGDIYFEQEKWLVDNYQYNLKSDYLKVAHHGSKKSSSQLFLKHVLPKVAIISCAKHNSYGFPAKSAIKRLSKWSDKLHLTSLSGDYEITIK